jgi:hypothetical protein
MNAGLRRMRKSLLGMLAIAAIAWVCLSYSSIQAAQTPGAGNLFSVPKGWAEVDRTGGYPTWKGEESRKEFITIIEDDTMKGEIPNPSDQKFIHVVNSASAFPNFVAGISNWKIERLEREKLSSGQKVVLIGSYKDSHDRIIRFEEWKYFLKDGYGQIRYSEAESQSQKLRSRTEVAELLKRYHPFGI